MQNLMYTISNAMQFAVITNDPNQGAPGADGGTSGSDLNLPEVTADATQIQVGLGLVFGVIGALALFYIIYGGIQYVYSSGEPQKAAQAKQTIIYAVIGLVIAVSAETIVWTVLDRL